ncbi:MAG: nucleotidyltransferase substrate binding protein [Cyclonatronaceae bacterium]
MSTQDIRWIQRFSNYKKAFKKLEEAIHTINKDYESNDVGEISEDAFLDDIIKEGCIQRFEYTHELAWKVMKDYLAEVGGLKIYGSKDATREAFSTELISNGEVWMDMIKSRNLTSHTYNEDTAQQIFFDIIERYYPAFKAFQTKMQHIENEQT